MLTGKTVLIVGGSSGFGLQVASQALIKQANVIITGRDQQKLTTIQKQLSSVTATAQIETLKYNTADLQANQKLLAEIPRLDHVVSTLGGAMSGGFIDNSVATIRQAIEEKFFANLELVKSLYPKIRQGGTLTLTSGTGGHPANASGAIVGNQAINSLVKGLAIELAPDIRVNAVAPTWTPTGLWRNLSPEMLTDQQRQVGQGIPLKRVAEPSEVASAYLFLMQNDFVTGQVVNVDGGTSAL